MPLYAYSCEQCGRMTEELRPAVEASAPGPVCSHCDVAMTRDFSQEHPGSPLRAYDRPIEMFSCAPETPEQLTALRRQCPDVALSPDLLVPIARTPQQKAAILAACGFEDKSGRGG